jgi:hypothetical protein
MLLQQQQIMAEKTKRNKTQTHHQSQNQKTTKPNKEKTQTTHKLLKC